MMQGSINHRRAPSRRGILVGASAMLAGSGLARAQDARVVTMVVPFPAGSGTDSVARTVQPLLAAELNTSVIIENRPGGNAAVGSAFVARAAPDGLTLLFTTSTSHSITPFVSRNVHYDPVKDFTPLGQVGIFPVILVANATLPVTSTAELIAHVKARPGQLQYAYANGTGQVAGAALRTYAGLDVVAVPYRGSPAAVTDLIAGRIHFMFIDATTGLPHVRAKAIRGLAVTTEQPSRLIPELPTVAAAGLPMFNLSAWCGLFGPKGLPTDIARRIDTALAKAMTAPGLSDKLGEMGFEMLPLDAGRFAPFVQIDIDRWKAIIKDAGVTDGS